MHSLRLQRTIKYENDYMQNLANYKPVVGTFKLKLI